MVLQRKDASDSIIFARSIETLRPHEPPIDFDQFLGPDSQQQQSTKLVLQRHKSQKSGPSEPSALDTRSFCFPHPLSQELGQQESSSSDSANKESNRHTGDDGRLARHSPREKK